MSGGTPTTGRNEDGRLLIEAMPAVRQRQNGAGNAHRNYERYLALAREATLNGDTIEAENCYQHAEHYFRVMKDPTN